MNPSTDAQFLRDMAHQAEIGDPIEERDYARLREIADRLEKEESIPKEAT